MDEKGNRDKERTSEEYRQEAEEHIESLKQEWKVFGGTGIIVIAAVVAVIIICLAWFASNRQVSGGGMSVRVAGNDFELAAAGSESGIFDHLLTDSTEGISESATDSLTSAANSFKATDGGHTSITWALAENSHIENTNSNYNGIHPGSRGTITFYIIAKKTGTLNVNLNLQLTGLVQNDVTLIEVNDATQQLLEGHILLFTGYENNSYKGWISEDADQWEVTLVDGKDSIHTSTLSYGENGKLTWTADVVEGTAYPVTIYWIWPEVLGQYLFKDSSRIDGKPILFPNDKADDNSRNPAVLPSNLFAQMCSKADDATSNRYFMWSSGDTEAMNLISASVLEGLRSTNFNTLTYSDLCSYYNTADQYLGNHVGYLKLKLDAQ